jgi:endonuclease-3
MSNNRSAILSKVYKVLKKHYKPVAPPADRTTLEHLLYGCLLENARYEAADEAFAKLKELYFDWNEIRVTTVTELAEGMNGIPDAAAAAQRVKKALQSIFEANYTFDIELLKKQNLGKAEKDLEKINGTTPFVRAYVTQNALGGHSIPVSKGALDALHAVGAITDAEADKGQVPGLERAIPKNKGVEFGSLLQQLAADVFAAPASPKVKAVLGEIDPNFKDRLTERQARLEAEAAATAAAAKDARDKARAEARAEARMAAAAAEAKAAGKKSAAKDKDKSAAKGSEKSAPTADSSKPKDKEPTVKPAPSVKKKEDPRTAESDGAKSTAKGLAKRKPR